MTTYSISQLSSEFALTTRAIRFYEDKGLLAPDREGTRRIYSKRDRARLKLIIRGKKLGFSLNEIHELVGLYETASDEVPQLLRYRDKLAEHRRTLEQQKQELEAMLIEIRVAERECQATLASKGVDPD